MRPGGTFQDATDEEIEEIGRVFSDLKCKHCGSDTVVLVKWWTLEGKAMGTSPNRIQVLNRNYIWQCDSCGKRFRVSKSEKLRVDGPSSS